MTSSTRRGPVREDVRDDTLAISHACFKHLFEMTLDFCPAMG